MLPTARGFPSVFLRHTLALLLPILASCSLTKDQALNRTLRLAACHRFDNQLNRAMGPCYTNILDWDGLETNFHFVRRQSSTANTTIVFIHGYPASLFTWADLLIPTNPITQPHATDLASRANLLAVDLPGHGFSKSPRNFAQLTPMLSPDGAAQSVMKFLNRIEVTGNVVLVGHSYGALVAMNVARQIAEESNRSWRITGLVLISPEGAPRTTFDYLPVERDLREGISGFASRYHFLARWFGWILEPGNCICEGNYWRMKARQSIIEVTSNKNLSPPYDQKQAYALLMRIKENYLSNRALVRRSVPGESELIQWAGDNFQGSRVLLWADCDTLFPVWRDAEYYQTRFKPQHGVQLLFNSGHIAPEDASEQIARNLEEMLAPASH